MTREQYRPLIHATAAKHGLDPWLFEAMIEVESNFRANAVSVSGAIGLGQIIPRWHVATVQAVAREQGRIGPTATIQESGARSLLFVPELNIEVAARHLKWCIDSCRDTWNGIGRYHSGMCDYGDFKDGGGTPTAVHVAKVQRAYEALQPTQPPPPPPPPPLPPRPLVITDLIPGSRVSFGWQAPASRALYDYAPGYGYPANRHTGIDVAAPYHTPVFAPRAGVVRCVGSGKGRSVDGGPCAAFADTGSQGPGGPIIGAGRVELELDNGAVWIAGHARTATKPLGATVQAGEQVATVGGMFGAHIHFEARIRDPSTRTGWRLVDPATMLGGRPPVPAPVEPEEPPMSVPVRQAFIPARNANRPQLPMVAEWITIHSTGNRNAGANAEMHRRFTHDGGGPSGVSFHYVVDDKEIIQLLPHNENGWHAGDGFNGVGNRKSIAIERCVHTNGNQHKMYENTVWLVRRLLAGKMPGSLNQDRLSVERVRQHNHWSGKNCPQRLRAGSDPPWTWTHFIQQVRTGTIVPPSPPAPEWANPHVPEFLIAPDGIPPGHQILGGVQIWRCHALLTAVKATPVRRFADHDSPKLRADIPPGESFTTEYVMRVGNATWALTRYGSRIEISDCSPRITVEE